MTAHFLLESIPALAAMPIGGGGDGASPLVMAAMAMAALVLLAGGILRAVAVVLGAFVLGLFALVLVGLAYIAPSINDLFNGGSSF